MDASRNSDIVEQARGVIAARLDVDPTPRHTSSNAFRGVSGSAGTSWPPTYSPPVPTPVWPSRVISTRTAMASNPPLKRSAESDSSLERDLLQRAAYRLDFQCAGCGYGAVSAGAPRRCPMCGGETWDLAPRRLFPTRQH
jgi:hypothetical protein